MADVVLNLIVMLGAELFFGLVNAGVANKELAEEPYPTPVAVVSAEPLTVYAPRTATEAEALAAAAELPELRRRAQEAAGR